MRRGRSPAVNRRGPWVLPRSCTMSSMLRFVGLDVHKHVLQICIIDATGKVILKERLEGFDREKLLEFARVKLHPQDRVALEATTNTWAVARLLRPFVSEVVASNPLTTKAIAQAKVKTDKIDAEVLAQLLRCDYLPQVWQPDEATSLLRELTSRRTALVGPAGRAWLQSLSAEQFDAQGRLILDTDLRLHDAIQREIETLEEDLARRGYNDARVKLLMTLPGVNVMVAEALLAALGDVSRFATADHAASYLGLTPSTRQSGDRCYHGPITKAGNSHARWALVQAAHSVARHPGPLGHFFQKLAKKKNYNVAVVATARKLVVIAWHMLTKNEPYRYAVPRSTEEKLRRLRVKATGERRKSGPAKGTKSKPLVAGGGRTIKSLSRVYREEGLPEPRELTPGERRTVEESGTGDYVGSLASDQVVPRRKKLGHQAGADG